MREMLLAAAFTAALMVFSVNDVCADWGKYDKPVPTTVVVRVLSHGAKSMSPNTGALVVIRDAATNKLLAKGDVQGSTGDTTALMETGYARKTGMTGLLSGQEGLLMKDASECEKYTSSGDSAKFVALVEISEPTQVVIQAQGPMIPHQAGSLAVTTAWLFPGENVVGEGIVLELRGLIVDCMSSLKQSELDVKELEGGITVPFYMNMMCGCPIAPRERGLPWEAEDFKITTQAFYKGELYHEEVTTSDKLFVDISSFKANIPLPSGLPEGEFSREKVMIRVMAAQPKLANYGLDEFDVYLTR